MRRTRSRPAGWPSGECVRDRRGSAAAPVRAFRHSYRDVGRPTGFSSVPPPGPAIPVTPTPMSALQMSRIFSASASATSLLTAPWASIIKRRHIGEQRFQFVRVHHRSAQEVARTPGDRRNALGHHSSGARLRHRQVHSCASGGIARRSPPGTRRSVEKTASPNSSSNSSASGRRRLRFSRRGSGAQMELHLALSGQHGSLDIGILVVDGGGARVGSRFRQHGRLKHARGDRRRRHQQPQSLHHGLLPHVLNSCGGPGSSTMICACRPSRLCSHCPGAVPRELGITSAPVMTSAWRALFSGIDRRRSAKRLYIAASRSLSRWRQVTPTARPRTPRKVVFGGTKSAP